MGLFNFKRKCFLACLTVFHCAFLHVGVVWPKRGVQYFLELSVHSNCIGPQRRRKSTKQLIYRALTLFIIDQDTYKCASKVARKIFEMLYRHRCN